MKILVVDGLADAAENLTTSLIALGWTGAGAATNSDDAIEWINTHGGCDILITEIFLQPADGFLLRETIQPHLPEMKTVFTSVHDVSAYAERMAGHEFLSAPVDPAALDSILRKLTGALRTTEQPAAAPSAASPKPEAAATPTAQPHAVASAQPTAVASVGPKAVAASPAPHAAQPRAVAATPTAQPHAVAAAQPTAVASVGPKAVASSPAPHAAQPRAVAATPTAQPRAVAAAQPTAVASVGPKAVASSPAPHAAQPRAVAATPTAQPHAVAAAQPTAVASVGPKAVAASPAPHAVKAVAQRASLAQPTAKPPAAQAPRAGSPKPKPAAVTTGPILGFEIELSPDELVGKTIGNYLIEARIGKGPAGPIYRASQTSINRSVRFYALDPSLARDPAAVERFLSNARAKAKATNPVVIAVYEAGEAEGVYYYSCEYVPCRSVGQLRESGEKLDEATARAAVKAAAEALDFFAREKISHDLLSENALLIGPANHVRFANIACATASQAFDLSAEMRRVGEIILGSLPESGAEKVRDMATILTDPSSQPPSWAAFLQTIAAYQPKIVIADAYKLDAQDRAAIRVVEESKKRQKRNMIISTVVSLALLLAALLAIKFSFFRQTSATVRDLDKMIEIPPGEFIYQDGKKINLTRFYIAEHEVTIGQYAQFLEFLKNNPDQATKFDSPDQPKGKFHVPVGWADMKELNPPMPGYYSRAKRWGRYQEAALDVNSPVFGVDWFDAYAYAKWKGRRLPTEEEWEKAARGTDGRKFSWGSEEDPTRSNTGKDLDHNPKKGGDKDGFKRWNPVDAKKGDKSPFGMIGASGNVSEWTATIADNPEGPGKVPVIRGGNWKTPDPSVVRRVLKLMDIQADDALGFRTASDSPPEK